MSFEEKFPSLKDKITNEDSCGIDFVYLEDVEKHCLDKQKLKETIEKILDEPPRCISIYEEDLKEIKLTKKQERHNELVKASWTRLQLLKKELGLE